MRAFHVLAVCAAGSAAVATNPNQVAVGSTSLWLCTDKIVRVTHVPDAASTAPTDRVSLIAKQDWAPVKFTKSETTDAVTVTTAALKAVVTKATGAVAFFELDGATPVLSEFATNFNKKSDMGKDTYVVEQQWVSSDDEALYGGGEFQNGLTNFKNAPVQLVQFNTEAIVPFFVSSKGYGLLWDNYAWSYLNPADPSSALTFKGIGADTAAGTLDNGAAIGLHACDGSDWHQQWNFTAESTLALPNEATHDKVLDMDHSNDILHLWTRNPEFNMNQVWSHNGSLVVNVNSQTCLTASDATARAVLKSDAKCDSSNPLQQWSFDGSTGLLALQSTVLSGQRHAQQRGLFHFDTDVSRGFNGAMCLMAGAPPVPSGVATFTATADGVHHFYMDACPGGFGCGGGKTARLWIDDGAADASNAASIFDWEQLDNMPNSIMGRATLTKGKTYKLNYVAKGFKSATPPVLVQPPTYAKTTLRSDLGNLVDYYFTFGGTAGTAGAMDGAIAGYRAVTGAAPKYPLWAYGFWQCREHYATQSELLAAAHGFRNRSIPVDSIVQDWHYWGNLGWGPQWDPAFYPDPAGMVKELASINMQLMVSVWSKYDTKTSFYKDMTAKGQMLNGTVYYDAWNAVAREQFYQYSKKAHFDIGVACLWLDATEPEGFPNVDHNTALGSGNALMNSYSLETTRAISDGLRRDFATAQGARPFTLTRSSFAAQQGSGAALWSGDISGKWDSLRRQVAASLNYALSGMPYWSEDIGGFYRPSDQYTSQDYHDLLCRWFQFGAFTPLYRVHGGGSHTEMWNYGDDVMGILNNTNNLRYRFLPYTYTGFHRVETEGYTMQRHLVLDFGAAHADAADTFMWGDSVLVAPIVTQADNLAASRDVTLPGSGRWFDFWSGETTAGAVRASAPIEQSPIFVRAGSVLPLGPLKQWSGENRGGPLEVRVFAGADGAFTLYEDDGASRDYQTGGSSTIAFAWDDASRTLTIGARQGTFAGIVGSRTLNIVAVTEGRGVGLATTASPDAMLTYTGAAATVKL